MTLPPKIELALGYLGGTEANRIREYILTLDTEAATLRLHASQLADWLGQTRQELAEAKKEISRLQGFLAEDWKP